MDVAVAVDDARAGDVQALLATHLAFSREVTPPGHVHALAAPGLLDPAVTVVAARHDGHLVGMGALRRLDDRHAEIKSMHVTTAARGHGVGRAVLGHLLALAAEGGYRRVSLETGTMAAFAPARTLYASAGFVPCAPFGEYSATPHSTCMTIALGTAGAGGGP